MTEQDIKEIENIIGYKFHDANLLCKAYTRRSYTEENPQFENNETFETLGDGAIYFYTIQSFFEHNLPINDEAVQSTIRREIICGENLAYNIDRLGLAKQEYFFLGKGDIKQEVWKTAKIKEDLFESIIGAIAYECFYETDNIIGLDEPIRKMLDLDALFEKIKNIKQGQDEITPKQTTKIGLGNDNPINYLQELYKSKQIPLPKYTFDFFNAPETAGGLWGCFAEIPLWTMQAKSGAGKTKTEAKLAAAKKLYEYVLSEIKNKKLFNKKTYIQEIIKTIKETRKNENMHKGCQ